MLIDYFAGNSQVGGQPGFLGGAYGGYSTANTGGGYNSFTGRTARPLRVRRRVPQETIPEFPWRTAKVLAESINWDD